MYIYVETWRPKKRGFTEWLADLMFGREPLYKREIRRVLLREHERNDGRAGGIAYDDDGIPATRAWIRGAVSV